MSKPAESTSVVQTLHEFLQPESMGTVAPLGGHVPQPELSHTAGAHGGASPEPRPKLLHTNGDGATGGLGGLNADQQSASVIALSRLQGTLIQQLDVVALVPSLKALNLLTPHEEEQLLIPEVTRVTKVNLLCSWLPRKGDDFLEKFIRCLCNPVSSDGTSHKELADKLKQLKKNPEMDITQWRQKNQDTSHLDISEEVDTKGLDTSPLLAGNRPEEPRDEDDDGEHIDRRPGWPVLCPSWCSKMCCISYSVLVPFLVGLIVFGFVVGVDFQRFGHFNATEVRPPLGPNNTTMELHFSLSNDLLDKGWISIDPCEGYLSVADGHSCSDFRTKYTYNYTVCNADHNLNKLFFYMLPGSTIEYTLSQDGVTKEVWVFTDHGEYNKLDKDLSKWSCSDPPPSPFVKCYFVNNVNNTITIEKDGEANYYIAYWPDESDIQQVCINRVVYDEEKISSHFSRTRVTSKPVLFSFGNKFSRLDDSCVVLSVQNCSIYSPPLVGALSVQIVKRSIDFIHVSAIWSVVLTLAFLIVVVVHVCHIRKRRRPHSHVNVYMTDTAE